MENKKVLLEIKNLTVGIKREQNLLKAVNNVSFSLNEGEITGLAGESGSGKSMTALSITNLLPPGFQIINGEISLNGKTLTSMNENELRLIRGKEIGIIFQDTKQALNPLMKAGKQITEQLTINKEKETKKTEQNAEKEALELLVSLGFEDPEKIFDAYPHQLSGGMCQRVMAAIASITRPRLLLADEPSSSLDDESLTRILTHLTEMSRNYKTSVLIISHDLSIIREYCSRFLVMYAGNIVEEGPSGALYSPLHPYTKALIDSIPDKGKRGKILETIPGKAPSIEDRFTGCPFAPRCAKAQKICSEKFPSEKTYNTSGENPQSTINRKVYCHYPENGENTDG